MTNLDRHTHVPGAHPTPHPASTQPPEWNIFISMGGHQPLSLRRSRVLGELTTASLSRVVPPCLSLPWATPSDGPNALRGEDRGEPPQLTSANPRSLTLTLRDWASSGSLVTCRMLVSETTCSSWASATLFPSLYTPWTCARQTCSHTPATTGPASIKSKYLVSQSSSNDSVKPPGL